VYAYTSLRGCLVPLIDGDVGVNGVSSFLDDGGVRDLGEVWKSVVICARSLEDPLRRACSSRMDESGLDIFHLDPKTRCDSADPVAVVLVLGEAINTSSCEESRSRSSSSPLAMSASRSMGEPRSEGSVMTQLSASAMANWMSAPSNSNSWELVLSGKEEGVEGKDAGKGEG
jgi:hypothetical protein